MKHIHECQNCGRREMLERYHKFRDEDFYELFAEHQALEHHHDVMVNYLRAKLAAAYERIEQMRELMT